MKITPEQIYQIWHFETFAVKGTRVRAVQDFSKAKEKPEWQEFVKFAGFVERNESISPRMYIKAIAHFWNGWFPPVELNNRKCVTIYRDYVSNLQANNDPNVIFNQVLESIKFIAEWCHDRNVESFTEYLHLNKELVPPLAIHYENGSVSPYFIAMLGVTPDFIQFAYPKDLVFDYFGKLLKDYENIRARVVRVEALRPHWTMQEMTTIIDNEIAKLISKYPKTHTS